MRIIGGVRDGSTDLIICDEKHSILEIDGTLRGNRN